MLLSELPALNSEGESIVAGKINQLLGRISVGPIGLDLGRSQAHAVQLQYRNGITSIRAATSLPYPCLREHLLEDSVRLKAYFKELFALKNFSGRDIVTCINAQQLHLASYDYSVSDGKSEAQHILRLVKQHNSEPLEDLVIDYIPARRSDHESGERTAMIAVAKKSEQLEFLELLRKAGVYVQSLEIGPIAIRRLIKTISISQSTPNVLVINAGSVKSYFTVLSGRRLLLDRGIDFGQNAVMNSLASALELNHNQVATLLNLHGLDPSQPVNYVVENLVYTSDIRDTIIEILKPQFMGLVQEIEKVSSYVHSQLHGADIQRIFLIGSFAYWPGAEIFVQNLLGRKVEILDPFLSFREFTSPELCSDVNAVSNMALATGCALSEMPDHG